MSRPASTLYDQLTCSVCLQRYKDPRTLPCHHSFCRVCLERVPVLEQEEAEPESGDEQHEAAKLEQQATAIEIKCPCCRKSVFLPPSGVSELPTAFLINNLLEVQKAAEYETVQITKQVPAISRCEEHERILEFYCNDCGTLVCSVCAIKGHRNHDCDLAADVAKDSKKVVEDQLALLRKDVTHVDGMIAHIESAKERVIFEGEKTKEAITDAVELLHRHVEDGKTKLVTTLNQNIEEKLKPLEDQCEKGLAIITQMRKSESVVEGRLEKLKNSIEIMPIKDELMQLISKVRVSRESIKFTVPYTISFSSNPSPSNEIGLLIEPAEKDATKEALVGRKCSYLLCLPETEENLVCHLVPFKKDLKSSECQIRSLENGKHKVSFTPNRVGSHDLVMFPLSPIKRTTIAQFYVNSPLLDGDRREISKRQSTKKPSALAISVTGDLIVCETASDCVTVYSSNLRQRFSSISSLGSSKKCLNKPCCVGVTPDKCLIVVDSGKQCYRLLKIKMDGKLIATARLADKLQVLYPNALAVHPSGGIFIVDSVAHSILVLTSNLNFCRTFGGKGKAHGYFDQPHSIAFDSAGSAYVSDSMNDRIQKFSASGMLQVDASFVIGNGSELSQLKRPTALCISSYDTLFVTDEHHRIAVFNTQGYFLGEIRYGELALSISPTKTYAMVVGKDESFLSVLDSSTETLFIIK